jgi:hypothetical protein
MVASDLKFQFSFSLKISFSRTSQYQRYSTLIRIFKFQIRNSQSEIRYFFFGAFISDSSITGAGPEIPPSLRMRQKCTAIKIDATNGIPMQCQM